MGVELAAAQYVLMEGYGMTCSEPAPGVCIASTVRCKAFRNAGYTMFGNEDMGVWAVVKPEDIQTWQEHGYRPIECGQCPTHGAFC